MTIADYQAGQGGNVVLPDIFRAVVACCRCHAIVAFGAPVLSPATVMEGLVTAGLLLGAGVDVLREEERHEVLCRGAVFAYEVQEVARKELPGLAPWLGIGA